MRNKVPILFLIFIFSVSPIASALVVPEMQIFSTEQEECPVEQVRTLLENNYVEPVSETVLEQDTIEAMLKELNDPYTTHMSKESYQAFLDSLDRTFSGIGLYFEMLPEGMLVTSVIAGGPAEKAGFLAGDIIITADGKTLAGLTGEEAATIIRGPEGTPVELTLKRDHKTIKKTVIRDEIHVHYVTGDRKGDIGYIDINSFGSNVGDLVGEEISRLNSEKWILDLRNNHGGYMQGARDVLGYITPGEIALGTRNRNMNINYTVTGQDFSIDDNPLIVLINRFSASASEIVAAALKDHDRALLMGETTYGKGTVQSLIQLSDGSVLKMTTWRFYSPKGDPIDQVGVTPHLKIEEEHLLKAAELILCDGDHELLINEKNYSINLKMARSIGYWRAYKALLSALSESDIWRHYYPAYHRISNLEDVKPEDIYGITFNQAVDAATINEETLKLKKAKTGEKVDIEIIKVADHIVYVKPKTYLATGKEYWLKVNEGVESQSGKPLQQAVIATITID